MQPQNKCIAGHIPVQAAEREPVGVNFDSDFEGDRVLQSVSGKEMLLYSSGTRLPYTTNTVQSRQRPKAQGW